MLHNVQKWLRSRRGQGLIEYAMILVLVVIVGIGVLQAIGNQVNDVFQNVSTQLGNA